LKPLDGTRRRLNVELQPVLREAADDENALGEPDRLVHVAVGSALVGVEQVLAFARCGKNYNGEHAGPRMVAHAAQHFQSSYPGKLEVQQDERRQRGRQRTRLSARREQIVERILPVPQHNHGIGDLVLPEGLEGQRHIVGVVVDDENALVHRGSPAAQGFARSFYRNGFCAPLVPVTVKEGAGWRAQCEREQGAPTKTDRALWRGGATPLSPHFARQTLLIWLLQVTSRG